MSSTLPGASPSHSLHMPYQARWTHRPFSGGSSSVGAAEGAAVVLGILGGEVIVLCSCVVVLLDAAVVSSWQPQNRPGVMHVVLVAVGVVEVVVVLVVVLSLQPNHPLSQVSKTDDQNRDKPWAPPAACTYGVWHVVVDDVDVVVTLDVSVPVVVVVSSKQPHQPLHDVSGDSREKKTTSSGNLRCLARRCPCARLSG